MGSLRIKYSSGYGYGACDSFVMWTSHVCAVQLFYATCASKLCVRKLRMFTRLDLSTRFKSRFEYYGSIEI